MERTPAWFTSDLHFGHKNIVKYENRPFNDVDEMNRALVDRWNRTVGPGDTVWIIGDFAMGKIVDNLPIAKDLNGEKLLVPGNHDRCWSGLYDMGTAEGQDKWRTWCDRYEEVGLQVQNEHELITADDWPLLGNGGTPQFELSHFPHEDHDGRYPVTPVTRDDRVLVHGHVHSLWRMKGTQINVGIDAWGGEIVSEIVLQHAVMQGGGYKQNIPW